MPPLLLLLFVLVPVVELWIVLQVRDVIGLDWTILALLVISVAGAVLVKREGLKAWQRFRVALAEARLPAREVTDGALLLVGGALMVTPGFLTDAVGLLLVVPLSRGVLNRALRTRVRASLGLGAPPRDAPGTQRRAGGHGPPRATHDDSVVDVEVVRVERDDGDRDDDSPPGSG